MIYITGDTHGDYYDLLNRIEPYSLGKDDILIVCGDFGFVWRSKRIEQYLIELMKLPLK